MDDEKITVEKKRRMPFFSYDYDAYGVIAIGRHARGIVAIGTTARGVIAFGIAATGLISFGVLAQGLISFGVVALGLLAGGSFSLGVVSFGAISVGILSLGAVSAGEYSIGALAFGRRFAMGDCARGLIALGDSSANGELFETCGALTGPEVRMVRDLLMKNAPPYLKWAAQAAQWFIGARTI